MKAKPKYPKFSTPPSNPPPPLVYDPPTGPLNVVHVDDHILVLSKPAGLLSVPGKNPEHADCLESRAKAEFPQSLLVHRLDLETSGLFLMAMNKDAQGNLGKQFERRKVRKTYTAEVFGKPAQDSGTIDLPLICDWDRRPMQKVCHDTGKPARTDWHVKMRFEKSTKVRLEPLTGRSHQLRVHMMEIGHPILGDPFYAEGEALKASDRLMLHASRLEFHHPEDGRIVVFEDEFLRHFF